jgi:uncharacterized membrane protein
MGLAEESKMRTSHDCWSIVCVCLCMLWYCICLVSQFCPVVLVYVCGVPILSGSFLRADMCMLYDCVFACWDCDLLG